MTLTFLLLALITATNSSSSGATSDPVLLDFHADWCGPCRQVRPAVEQLIRKGYPVKSIDIDKTPNVAERYGIQGVPTFIVVDGSGRELDRTSGPQPAADLARFYLAAKAKAQPPHDSNAHVGARAESQAEPDDDDEPADTRPRGRRNHASDRVEPEPDQAEPSFVNPKPWETVVRIRVLGSNSVGYGSGTIISSTPEESLIVTCAHIFKIEGRRPVPPGEFPRKILVDLFDGQLQGTRPAQVHFLEAVAGEAVDYDFTRDVGLIHIRPGRQLPASRVVPAHWEPKSTPRPMKMLTVGCSEGNDATAWHTRIVKPRLQGFLQGNPAYEAIECEFAPKQGRSGGGLFTTDGYLAGICNFAEPQGNHGLYATPRSIYALLDRNHLMALYAPVSRGSSTMVAEGRSPAQPRRTLTPIARSQSPDPEEPESGRAVAAKGDVMLPHPSLLGITDPVASAGDRTPQAASAPTQRIAWHPTPRAAGSDASRSLRRAHPTDLNLNSSADHDRSSPAPGRSQDAGTDREGSTPGPDPQTPSKPRWRAVKAAPANPMLKTQEP
jgi:thiol-disulfide isomerase/thioredoxin